MGKNGSMGEFITWYFLEYLYWMHWLDDLTDSHIENVIWDTLCDFNQS